MAKKESRISINKWEKLLDDNRVVVPLEGAEDIEIVIKPTLSLTEVLQFVEDVVSVCVNAGTGAYTPEVKDFMTKAELLTMYANFNMPSSVEKQYDLIYRTGVLETVEKYINWDQYAEICRAIEDRINHELSMMENSLTAQMHDLASRLDSFTQNMEQMYQGVDDKEVAAVMKKIAGMGRLDERELVQAVFDVQKERDTSLSDGSETVELVPKDDNKVIEFPRPPIDADGE